MERLRDSSSDLADRYKSWETEELVRAVTLEADEYTAEAVHLIRAELEQRGVTTKEQEALQVKVSDALQEEERPYVGIKGWLAVFVVVFMANFALILVRSLFSFDASLPPSVKVVLALEGFLGAYALVPTWWLLSRDERGPSHAGAVILTFCVLELCSWLYFYWRDVTLQEFPFRTVLFTIVWWSYLSTSKRVRLTYRPEDVRTSTAS